MALSSGSKLGTYEILSPIGAGGMGEVYRAKDTRLGRQVAIKVLPVHLATDGTARARLRLEAIAAAALDHPFICKVFEIGEEGDVLFLVMEFIAGDTLLQRLNSERLPLPEALRIAGEVAEALEAAHNKQFVHRDLKPGNVMLTQGHVKVMDFGLAKPFGRPAPSVDESTQIVVQPLSELGTIVGTPEYMSPEQLTGQPLDGRADVFSFGILLCEVLGIPHPFRRSSMTETLAAILRDPPNLDGDLPQGVMLLIRRLLAKSRDDRYQSIADVRADLGRLTASTLAPEPTAGAQERIPLIGRDAERKELLRHLEEALAGRGSLVMIGGEPGIGKTHLITSLLEEARHRGAYTNIGHCYEMEGSPPYVPFIEMLEHTARVAPKEAFRKVLGDAAPEIAKLMPELRRMYSDIPLAIQLPPEQQRRFLFNAYREYLGRAAQITPIVHVLEDLHWADEPTLLLLQHVAQSLSSMPMLLIGTYRDVELEVTRPFAKTLESLLRLKQAKRISLRRLAASGVQGMLAAMSGQEPPPSLVRVVFEETEGNPFFVEEVFRHLSEDGKLFDDAGQWRVGLRVDQLQVPEGVRLVLGRRLDRLGVEARRVLTTAAVIGRSFPLPLLEALENGQPDAALDAVEEAERAHLVCAEPAAGREIRYRFVHELVRQTLADTLSMPRRQRVHARVADAIQRVYAANLDAQASSLAHHLYQAGAAADPEKTTFYLINAAQKARAGAAHEEALAHLENALSLWEGEQGVRVAELTEQRAAALLSIGRWDEAVEGYRRAISLFESAGQIAKAAATSLTLAMNYFWRIKLALAHQTIGQALQMLGPAEPQLQFSLLTLRATLLSAQGDVSGGLGLLAEVKARREAEASQPLSAFDEISEMRCLLHAMKFDQMLPIARRVAQTQRAAGSLWDAAEAEYFAAYELYFGPIVSSSSLAGTISLLERVGHYAAAYVAKVGWVNISIARGDLSTAEREMDGLQKFGEEHHVPWCFLSSIVLGTLAFRRGNFAEAERCYKDRTEIEEQTSLRGWRDASLFALWAETDPEENLEGNTERNARAWQAWTDRCWKLPQIGQPNPLGAWWALERSVIGLAWLGRKEEAAALRPLTEELVLTGIWSSLTFHLIRTAAGTAAACARDWPAAEQHHLAAIHQADTAPYRVSQPTAREWYASMLLDRNAPGDEEKGRGLFREALAMYESMGMPFHASRARRRLAAL